MDSSTNNSKDAFDQIKEKILSCIATYAFDLDILSSPSFINNLAIHLTIAILRIQSNNYIPLSNSQIAGCKDTSYYKTAQIICQNVADAFHITFPENEISLVAIYLSKNQLLDVEFNSGFDLLDKEVFSILKETMATIYQKYQQDFRDDDALFIAIGLHLTPALDRLQNNQMIENPLTNQIKERHSKEFIYSNILNGIITKEYKKSFSDDELAFIALHFIVAKSNEITD